MIESNVLLVAMTALAVPLGVVAWTLTEYIAHRFTMHSTGGRGPAAHEHLMHHAQPERTRPLVRVIGHISMYATALAIGLVLGLVMARPIAFALALGWAFGYTAYEGVHFHAHHHAPRGAYDLWLRKRHFHHHFVAPKTNLGVLVPWWDQLFGTEVAPNRIKVPRRVAMPWLFDEHGEPDPSYATDYQIVGLRRLSPAQKEDDIDAAFSDRPLALD